MVIPSIRHISCPNLDPLAWHSQDSPIVIMNFLTRWACPLMDFTFRHSGGALSTLWCHVIIDTTYTSTDRRILLKISATDDSALDQRRRKRTKIAPSTPSWTPSLQDRASLCMVVYCDPSTSLPHRLQENEVCQSLSLIEIWIYFHRSYHSDFSVPNDRQWDQAQCHGCKLEGSDFSVTRLPRIILTVVHGQTLDMSHIVIE